MFTGLIESIGTIKQRIDQTDGCRWIIDLGLPSQAKLQLGDSIAINGACLTIAELTPQGVAFDVSTETLARTCMKYYQPNFQVNVERSLTLQTPLGGHLVTGHIDGVAEVMSISKQNTSYELVFELPQEFCHYVAIKGSLTIDGVSLTVNGLEGCAVRITLIPHTLQHTTLGALVTGAKVNFEVDLIARYIERQLHNSSVQSCSR